MNNKKSFVKGIDKIFEDDAEISLDSKILLDKNYVQKVLEIETKKVFSNTLQPRKIFDENKILELAESIKMYGLISPIVVKKVNDNYVVIAGERRLRAVKSLKKTRIKALIFEEKPKFEDEAAIIENIQRENLNPLEEALAYKKIIETQNLTHNEVAKKFAKTRPYITNILRILNLPASTQKLILENKISQGHAKALLSLENKETIKKIAKRIVNENLSVRKVENIVNGYKLQENRNSSSLEKKENYCYYTLKLKNFLQTKVTIKKNKKIIISFQDLEDLMRILKTLGIKN